MAEDAGDESGQWIFSARPFDKEALLASGDGS